MRDEAIAVYILFPACRNIVVWLFTVFMLSHLIIDSIVHPKRSSFLRVPLAALSHEFSFYETTIDFILKCPFCTQCIVFEQRDILFSNLAHGTIKSKTLHSFFLQQA